MIRGVAGRIARTNIDGRPVQKWVLGLFLSSVAGCFCFYGVAIREKNADYTDLREKIRKVEALKQRLSEEREELLAELASRSDDDWMEMVLKKRLGVVPEGQTKVYFKRDE